MSVGAVRDQEKRDMRAVPFVVFVPMAPESIVQLVVASSHLQQLAEDFVGSFSGSYRHAVTHKAIAFASGSLPGTVRERCPRQVALEVPGAAPGRAGNGLASAGWRASF